MKDSKMINSTEEIKDGGIPGISDTVKGMEEYDMNKMNDVGGSHPDFNGPSKLGGKK